MNKKDTRHQLIRSIILENKIHTQQELQEMLEQQGVFTTQATLSRDIKDLNLVKVTQSNETFYMIHSIPETKWEKRLTIYMEDALILLRPVQNQVILKTLPGLASSFGSILDGLNLPEIIATVCGDDVCLIICENNEQAISCFETLKKYAPKHFFGKSFNHTEK